MRVYNNILEIIGNILLVKLNKLIVGIKVIVLVKVEIINLGNFVKDCMVVKMIDDVEKVGLIKLGGMIIEGISGNIGMGLVLVVIVKGYKLICVLNDKQLKEKMDILCVVGVEVVVCFMVVEFFDLCFYYFVLCCFVQEILNFWYVN